MLTEMKSYRHVKPGQNGSKRLVEQYGDRLLCVRYRYDEHRRIRLKTVEIIVEERPWQPPFRFRDEDLAPVAVGFGETELRDKLRKLLAKSTRRVRCCSCLRYASPVRLGHVELLIQVYILHLPASRMSRERRIS
jgi:hypothetical protein